MIEIRVSGGVGNQLFQYAFGYALAKRYNQELVLDKSYYDFDDSRSYELDKFKLNINKTTSYMNGIASQGLKRYIRMLIRILKKRYELREYVIIQENDIMPETLEKGNFYFRGFWQSENYFKQYRDELIRQMEPDWILSEEYCKWLDDIRKMKSVSIHIRRSDYLKYHAAIDSKYYILAIRRILKIAQIDMFYVFTDDVKWAVDFFAACPIQISYKIVSRKENLSDLEELLLMKACKYHIVANSSFSWWGAWLGDYENKIVIAPKIKVWNEKFYPENWILIDAEEENEKIHNSNITIKSKLVDKVKRFGYL